MRNNIFQVGKFNLHSGKVSKYKIECDNLTPEDVNFFVEVVRESIEFNGVYGVPRGGTRLAEGLYPYSNASSRNYLIVDDVLSSGDSMNEARKFVEQHIDATYYKICGYVFFNRGHMDTPFWVKSVFESGWAW